MGDFKCNSDSASKGNPRPSSGVFCVRDDLGNVVYAERRRFGDKTNLVVAV